MVPVIVKLLRFDSSTTIASFQQLPHLEDRHGPDQPAKPWIVVNDQNGHSGLGGREGCVPESCSESPSANTEASAVFAQVGLRIRLGSCTDMRDRAIARLVNAVPAGC